MNPRKQKYGILHLGITAKSALFAMVSEHSDTAQRYAKVAKEKGTSSYPRGWMDMNTEGNAPVISKEEAIRRIVELCGVYDPENTAFDVYDQLLACESIAEAHPASPPPQEPQRTEEVAFGNGSVDGGCKRQVNFELTPRRIEAINTLRAFHYRTHPPLIAEQLETLFEAYSTTPGWWLVVAQRWNPRAITRTLDELLGLQSQGWKTIKNPAAYFTYLIKFRKERKNSNERRRL